ncbi:MAG: hypothetical protein K9J27_11540 [Bacteroidales bacterium]|nr:hypothetical protein [Bacteroidales bacterium]
MPESDFQRYLNSKFEGVMNELGHIRHNTERINGKVAEQEKRIREMENVYNRCPIREVQRRTQRLEEDTQNIRIWTKMVKGGFAMALITAVGLILRIFEVI